MKVTDEKKVEEVLAKLCNKEVGFEVKDLYFTKEDTDYEDNDEPWIEEEYQADIDWDDNVKIIDENVKKEKIVNYSTEIESQYDYDEESDEWEDNDDDEDDNYDEDDSYDEIEEEWVGTIFSFKIYCDNDDNINAITCSTD